MSHPFDSEEYEKFVQSMIPHCHCASSHRPCDGVLAGGMCDGHTEDRDDVDFDDDDDDDKLRITIEPLEKPTMTPIEQLALEAARALIEGAWPTTVDKEDRAEIESDIAEILAPFLRRAAESRDPEKIEALIRAALRMPRGTPAPGCCATEHTYILSAGQVWALDAALIDLGFPYTPNGHSPDLSPS